MTDTVFFNGLHLLQGVLAETFRREDNFSSMSRAFFSVGYLNQSLVDKDYPRMSKVSLLYIRFSEKTYSAILEKTCLKVG